jgi:DNA-binding SARP family transcriptional activator
MKHRLRLTLLGGFDARRPPASALVLPTRKARALLAYLAIPLGRPHPREKLASLLWGDMPDAHARGNLRQSLSRIQRALARTGVSGMIFREDTVALDPSAVEVDVAAFEKLLGESRPEALEHAVGQYRGDLLEGLSLPERPFEEWLTTERDRLRELAIEALGRLLARQNTAGAADKTLQTALRLLALDPLQEGVHRIVMRLHSQAGRRAAALRQYQFCVDCLKRELGAAPEAETRQLYEEILRQRPVRLDPAALLGRVTAVRAPAAVPDLRPAAAIGETPLVGRTEEIGKLRALLDEAGAGRGRVIALIGEAGTGKSRLLQELVTLATQRGVRVLLGHSYQTEQVLPFGPWADAFRSGRLPDDDELLGELSPAVRTEMARLLPELGDGPQASRLPPNALQVFTALTQIIATAAARQPLVIILEDLQWADEMSVRLLAFVARRLCGWPIMRAVSARTESLADTPLLERTLHELLNESHVVLADVRPLSQADTMRLAQRVACPDLGAEAREHVVAQAWRLGEGNPFVVLETVRNACADGAPEPGGGVAPRAREALDPGAPRSPRCTGQEAGQRRRGDRWRLRFRAGAAGERPRRR